MDDQRNTGTNKTAEAAADGPDRPCRMFCAIEIPAEICRALTERVDHLRSAFPEVKASWNRDGKFHLTVKFIGEIPAQRVADLIKAAERAATSSAQLNLIVKGSGTFPRKGPPRVLWIGIDDVEGKLGALQQQLEAECERKHFAREAKGFHPHLTLARVRCPQGAQELAQAHREKQFGPVRFAVSELLVVRSELSPQGSRYTVVSQAKLKAN